MKPCKLLFLCFLPVLISCEKTDDTGLSGLTGFLTFSAREQTLPAAINEGYRQVRFEVKHGADISKIVPEFTVPDGYKVLINGVEQISGSSVVDFSKPVKYTLENPSSHITTWNAEAIPLKPKILVDASHDGGVWWFPQSELTGFDQSKPHQGMAFANYLREKGFEVDELGRGNELTEEMFFGYYIIIRANGFQSYTDKELQVYFDVIRRGTNMVFFTDHKKYDPKDELGYLLGLDFVGMANGTISRLKPHIITENISSINYIAGSVLLDPERYEGLEVLGWLGDRDYADLNFNGVRDINEPAGCAVMGILHLYPGSHIFFIGDMNGLEVMPQPFIDNLIKWMGICFQEK